MKKKLILMITLMAMCIGCTSKDVSIIEKKHANMDSYLLLKDKQHNFQTSSFDEALKFINDQKSAVFYIGYPDCAWCKEAIPILNKVAKAQNKKIYYIELYDKEGNKTFDQKAYEKFMSIAEDKLDKDEEGNPTLYVPFVFTLKKGVLDKTHISTIDGHNAKEREMSKKEKEKLKDIYTKLLH